MNYDDLAKKSKVVFTDTEHKNKEFEREQWINKTAKLYLDGTHLLSLANPNEPTKEQVYEAYLRIKSLTVSGGLLTDDEVHALKRAGIKLFSRPDIKTAKVVPFEPRAKVG